jgi:hypothetical protein
MSVSGRFSQVAQKNGGRNRIQPAQPHQKSTVRSLFLKTHKPSTLSKFSTFTS